MNRLPHPDPRPLLAATLAALLSILLLAACSATKQLSISSASIPADRFSLNALLPSAVPGALAFAAGDASRGGGQAAASSAVTFDVDETGPALAVLPGRASRLPRDQQPEVLMADASLLATLNPGSDSAQAVRVGFRPQDLSPDNFAQVLHTAGLPGKGICDVDYLGNIYVRIRHEGDLTELWAGSKHLSRIEMPEHIRCMGEYWSQLGREVLVVTEDNALMLVDPAQAKLAAAPQLAWAGSAAAKDGRDLSDLRYIALNDKLALLRFADVICAYSTGGAKASVVLLGDDASQPGDGAGTAQSSAADTGHSSSEGSSAGKDGKTLSVSKACNCVALAPDSVAIVDRAKARLLLLRADKAK